MPAPSKIVDEAEAIRWYEEGRTFQWMVDEYRRKYNVETTTSMWSNWRNRRGLEHRYVRDDELVPWSVLPEHKASYALAMLRVEAQRRAGIEMDPDKAKRLESWLTQLDEAGAVVYYDPETDEGFHYVERAKDDTDIIRKPSRHTKIRKAID